MQERAVETVLLRHAHRLRPDGVAAHRSTSHVRVRFNSRAHAELVRHRTRGRDLDARHAALGYWRTDGQRVPADSNECKEARCRALHGLLHVLADVSHLRLRLTIGDIAGAAGSYVRCCVPQAHGGNVFGSNHNIERVRSGWNGTIR